MKSITPHSIINNLPTIKISHKGLLAIQRLVALAPQEVQWFHTVTATQDSTSSNGISLTLSEKLYVPTQNTSATEVNTTSTMMIQFYNELKEDHSQEEVNQILSHMSCWCHSHHNMSPNSSGQDEAQFETLILQSIEQNMNTFQIMLIFNKKNQFYCKVYNPHTGNIHEGVPIELEEQDHDLSYIDDIVKTKLKKKTFSFKGKKSNKSPKNFKGWNSWNKDYFWETERDFKQSMRRGEDKLGWESLGETTFDARTVNETLLEDIMGSVCDFEFNPSSSTQEVEEIDFSNTETLNSFFETVKVIFDERDMMFFTKIYTNRMHEILDIFSVRAFNKLEISGEEIESELIQAIFKTKVSNLELYNSLKTTLDISDITTKKEYKQYLKSLSAETSYQSLTTSRKP